MRDGMEMMCWIMLEDSSLDPVVGLESGADGRGGCGERKGRTVDEDWRGSWGREGWDR
jgi:hypothetical protein